MRVNVRLERMFYVSDIAMLRVFELRLSVTIQDIPTTIAPNNEHSMDATLDEEGIWNNNVHLHKS